MITIPKTACVGVDPRGGPHNGPYAAGFLNTFLPGLSDLGVTVSNLYCNSGTVPGTVKAATGKTQIAYDTWADLTPDDVIVQPKRRWYDQFINLFRNGYRVVYGDSIFDGSPLYDLVRRMTPLDEVFSSNAVPVKFPVADYWSGKRLVFNNKNPKHREAWHVGMATSMGLVPFLPVRLIPNVIENELLADPLIQTGPNANCAAGFDGGYIGNLMLEQACRDGIDVLFVVDINGLELAPLDSKSYHHWSLTLQRAFSVLVTTNDHRHLMGLERMNEVLTIRDQLHALMEQTLDDESLMGSDAKILATKVMGVIDRMDHGDLQLHGKHLMKIVKAEDRENSRPFDFSNFTRQETKHLLDCGTRSAHRILDQIKVVAV